MRQIFPSAAPWMTDIILHGCALVCALYARSHDFTFLGWVKFLKTTPSFFIISPFNMWLHLTTSAAVILKFAFQNVIIILDLRKSLITLDSQ